MPALLNMMSTPPQESRCLTAASTSDSLDTSHLMVSSRGGSGRIEWTFDSAVARAGSDMSTIRTAAPSRAKRMVVSRPMPLGIEWRRQRQEIRIRIYSTLQYI